MDNQNDTRTPRSKQQHQVLSRTVHFFFSFGFSSSNTEVVGAALLNMLLLPRLLPRSEPWSPYTAAGATTLPEPVTGGPQEGREAEPECFWPNEV